MNLPFFKKQKKQDTTYFLTLLLQDEKITAAILQNHLGELSLFSAAESQLSKPLESATFEQILEACDKAISQAEQKLPIEIPTHQTVFGVHSSWTEEGHITKERLAMLKQICDELSLSPIGFLVFTEAIIHLLQQEEGAPVSAIVVEKDLTTARVSLVRAGRILESKMAPLEENLPELVDQLLHQITSAEVLPSRIVLFDGDKNEEETQAFLDHKWSKSLPFLHIPQVTILPPNFDLRGILFGTATQLGLHMSKASLEDIKTTQIIPPLEEAEVPMATTSIDEDESSNEPAEAQATNHQIINDEEDTQQTESISEDKKVIASKVGADYFGFVQGKDVAAEHTRAKPKFEIAVEADNFTQALPDITREEEEEGHSDDFEHESGLMVHGALASAGSAVGGIVTSAHKLFANVHFKFPAVGGFLGGSSLGKKLIIISVIVLVAGIGSYMAYNALLHGTITLIFTPQPLTKDIPVTFTTDASKADSELLVSQVMSENTITDNLDPTGTKDVGTPAKGSVSIFSRSTDPTTLAQGTQITASSGQVFTLDNSTPIASFSGGPDDPSLVVDNVAVTAKDIGTDSNLPAGTKFSINGQSKSDMSAKNDAAFTGGTKSTLTVVSQADIDKLTAQVLQKAKDQASPALSQKDPGKNIISESATQSATNENFSAKLGDQVKTLSLTATVDTTALAYTQSDLTNFVTKQLASAHGSDTTIESGSINTKVDNTIQKKSTVTAMLHASASLIPTIDTNDLIQKLAGKSFGDVQIYLKTLPQLQDATLQLSPALPFLPQRLPAKAGNIKIVVKSS